MTSRLCIRLAPLVLLGVGLTLTASHAMEPISAQDALPATPGASVPRVQEVEDAAALFRKGDADGALKLLRDAVKKRPELSLPHVILAGWFAETNQPALVRTALEQAIAEGPDDPEPYLVLGEIDSRARMLAEAGCCTPKRSIWPSRPKRHRRGSRRSASGR